PRGPSPNTSGLSDAGEKLEEILGKEYAKMSMTLAKASMPSPNADLETRADFLQYACPIELDPNTANPHLSLSNRNRKVAFLSGEQDYPKHSNRFNYSWQVLSRQSLTGRCYLEVERSSSGVVVAVAYKSMGRAGIFSDCVFGLNDKSWALDCFEFRHNEVKTAITATWTPRVGVFLDHSAGVLCFYGISDTMTLLHRVQTTFTEPLHAGLWLSNGATAELCSLQPDRSNTV
uniref:B30.2/SPRY domain-containing protein n=1 Tax=Salarias fasciatus TaxID=181472 RepID=A0A672HJT6_SALFA